MLRGPRSNRLVLVVIGIALAAGGLLGTLLALAAGGGHWTTSTFSTAEGTRQLEFKRTKVCYRDLFGSPPLDVFYDAEFNGRVLHAEVFLSGFNMSYFDEDDHELHNLAVDSWVEKIGFRWDGQRDPNNVAVRVRYDLRDEETTLEDRNWPCADITVIALTQP